MLRRDLAAVLLIQQQCYSSDFQEPVEAFESKWMTSPDTCWVAELGGEVCAYLVCLPIQGRQLPVLHASDFRCAEQANWLYVHDLAIGHAARGSGLAPVLIRQAMARRQEWGLQDMGLIAVQDSCLFWRKFGFEVDESERLVSADKLATFGADAVFMIQRQPSGTAA